MLKLHYKVVVLLCVAILYAATGRAQNSKDKPGDKHPTVDKAFSVSNHFFDNLNRQKQSPVRMPVLHPGPGVDNMPVMKPDSNFVFRMPVWEFGNDCDRDLLNGNKTG